jgi:hypothetical protein
MLTINELANYTGLNVSFIRKCLNKNKKLFLPYRCSDSNGKILGAKKAWK